MDFKEAIRKHVDHLHQSSEALQMLCTKQDRARLHMTTSPLVKAGEGRGQRQKDFELDIALWVFGRGVKQLTSGEVIALTSALNRIQPEDAPALQQEALKALGQVEMMF